MTEKKRLEDTKRLMGALLRMPPKPHSEMKIRKRGASRPSKKNHAASAKPKNA
jgi:hypothetical protein